MNPAQAFVTAVYGRFGGRVPVKVGLTFGFGAVYPLVFEDQAGVPIGLVGCAWNQGQDPKLVQVYHISAFKPARGDGTTILKFLCAEADRHDVSLYVQATAQYAGDDVPMDDDALAAWYRKVGFRGYGALTRQPFAA